MATKLVGTSQSARPPKRAEPLELNPAQHPRVYQFIAHISEALRVPMPGRPPGTVREVPYPVFPDLSQDPATQAWTCP